MGCTIFGGVQKEQYQFNVDSLWTGNDTTDYGAFQNFGYLSIELGGDGEDTDYRRELNLSRAVSRVSYRRKGVHYLRETFCSHPGQVMISRLTADATGQYTGRITLNDTRKAETKTDSGRISFTGVLPNGMVYEVQVLVMTDGGTMSAEDEALTFKNCNGLTLILAASTSYAMDADKKWKGEHPHKRLMTLVDRTSKKNYTNLLKCHVADHRTLYDRVRIDLGDSGKAVRAKTLDERIKAVQLGGFDPDLEELVTVHG